MRIEELLESLPEVSFIENKTYEDVKTEMVSDFLEEFKRLTGENASLSEANVYMSILNAVSLQIYQGYEYIDYSGKMGLAKYTHGNFLDNMAILKGIVREKEKAAFCEVEFRLASVNETTISIPQGTRITDGNLYFFTDEYAEIKAGKLTTTVKAICSEKGAIGNGVQVGRINAIVNPIPFVSAVRNVTESTGGEEEDTDLEVKDELINPQNSDVAVGTEEAYKYFAKKADLRVGDVKVESNKDSTVEITIAQKDVGIPESSLVNLVLDYVKNKDRKGLADKVEVSGATKVEYDIRLTYYISEENRQRAESIRSSVEQAVHDYVKWQGERMGRDINPSVLIGKIVEAGAKRAEIVQPVFTKIGDKQIAKKREMNVTYGGLENG